MPHEEPVHPEGRRVKGGRSYDWPIAEGEPGGTVDLSVLPEAGTMSEMLYLKALREGWYEVDNPKERLALRVEWDVEQMPFLWYWQEYGASGFYPWYGRHYNIGLEPFSSYPTNGIEEAVSNGTAMLVGARKQRRFSLRVEVLERSEGSEERHG